MQKLIQGLYFVQIKVDHFQVILVMSLSIEFLICVDSNLNIKPCVLSVDEVNKLHSQAFEYLIKSFQEQKK
ncbi:MAG: hypothetical protein CVV41_09845 [Candidatus Riflebacteria bacterium HGW-Riflebacteria-1]|nr:MAG: hypothetical protein CVV41_09845 [Candidatus Riflebacteria bacterium HGW-Riflebacteria-1]